MKYRYITGFAGLVLAGVGKIAANLEEIGTAFIFIGLGLAILFGSAALGAYCDRRFGHED